MAEKTSRSVLYLDPHCSTEQRVKDLLARMTLEEKVRQMGFADCAHFTRNGKFSAKLAKDFFKDLGVGGLQDPRMNSKTAAEVINAIQKFLMNNTRLGIPALVTSECLHGHMSTGATIFPQAIGLASSWNADLLRRMAAAVAKEARAVGVCQAFSPDLDLARDPRWGRVEETYGEDPYLVGRMGVAYVKGLQGTGPKVDRQHVVATLKHFAAHGSPQGGINIAPVAVGERELRDTYLEPFRAAITEAGALSVMPAYSEFDGIPCSASKFLLRKILRDEWSFQGYTFSDYGAIQILHLAHKTAANIGEAGRQALEAGLDMEAPEILAFGKELVKSVKAGKVSIELIDQAVSNILRVKFLAGLFENPFADPKQVAKIVNHPRHRRVSRQVAQESIILLKNKNDLLPLDKKIKSLAVIGPNADVAELGDYCIPKSSAVTPLEGIRKAASSKTKINYASGCGLFELSKDGFAAAVKAAKESEAAIVFVGESSMSLGGVGWVIDGKPTRPALCGEGYDRADLNLPGVQQKLVEAVVATGTPTVVVLINGRPMSISWIAENVPSILEAWYPGEEGGHAIANVIFGKINPSGKLPISFPRSVGQVPNYYNHKPSAGGYYHRPGQPGKPGRDYVFMNPSSLFEFGHGLSYTKFKYSNLRVKPSRIAPAGQVHVSVDIRNTGRREGKEIVQLYINDVVSSSTTPVKTLRGFRKVNLEPKQKKTVFFVLTEEDLSLLDQNMRRIVEPGIFEVMVAGLKKQFEVVPKVR